MVLRCCCKKDHLHIRGEYKLAILIMWQLTGSPPHTWRILVNACNYIAWARITSTYVENTANRCWPWCFALDHLHIRGEYRFLHHLLARLLGSPPHTWRILRPVGYLKITSRITSTYVENTSSVVRKFNAIWDHLHIRGEYFNVTVDD